MWAEICCALFASARSGLELLREKAVEKMFNIVVYLIKQLSLKAGLAWLDSRGDNYKNQDLQITLYNLYSISESSRPTWAFSCST